MAWGTFNSANWFELATQTKAFLESNTNYRDISMTGSESSPNVASLQFLGPADSPHTFGLTVNFYKPRDHPLAYGQGGWDANGDGTLSGLSNVIDNAGYIVDKSYAESGIVFPTECFVVATKHHMFMMMRNISNGMFWGFCAGCLQTKETYEDVPDWTCYADICTSSGGYSSGHRRGVLSGPNYLQYDARPQNFLGGEILNKDTCKLAHTGWRRLAPGKSNGRYYTPLGKYNYGSHRDIAQYLKFDTSLSTVAIPWASYYIEDTTELRYYLAVENDNVRICNGTHLQEGQLIDFRGEAWMCVPNGGTDQSQSLLIKAVD
ncbi:hypothetical protein NVP2117O_42 [Vibrio phage 2.117.O._10N.261.45.E9]|nr:hypothetical protein NVP1117O_42 [Vibrio phage 1.117.O._10N.261.45.E9]AUR95443.1 hypothetical protein NVP1207B_36 [Vibrio phage 1.207.B._10N.222.51.C2]AUS02334.1 hypothetical protein NVP2117O_42 [Vibrio phage 2.117.O._10N.261.45.E9]